VSQSRTSTIGHDKKPRDRQSTSGGEFSTSVDDVLFLHRGKSPRTICCCTADGGVYSLVEKEEIKKKKQKKKHG